MPIPSTLKSVALDLAMALTDGAMALIPRSLPDREALQRCRIIAHRGEHTSGVARENTLQAFRLAADAGVWGIECDIRFTADLVPVICHDPSPERVFGVETPVAAMSFAELRATVADIPSLEEVVEQFGGSTHLMLEIKEEPWTQPQQQARNLQRCLATLEPIADYHLLALQTSLFERVDFAPRECFLPVAETNVSELSAYALGHGCAGLGGHYLLLGKTLYERHGAAGQRLGTGFPRSGNCLKRELNRGIEWVFTNHAVKLEGLRQQYLQHCTQ